MKHNLIKVDHHNGVLTAGLNRNVTNALNLVLITELLEIIKKVKHDPGICGLVLSSANNKFFSIGFDIPQLYKLSRSDFKIFYTTFNRVCIDLYSLPKPTVAAITGHAVAGGCILTLCCDYRYLAEGKKKMGLNEIKLGVPVPYPADCILRQIAGSQYTRNIIDTGEFFLSDELIDMGIVDKTMPADQVQAQTVIKASLLGSSQKAFAMIKQNRVEQVKPQILEKLEEKEENFLELWYADETRKRLKEAMKKF